MYKNKKTLCALAIAAAISGSAHANLIISEYVEGSSNNKAVEIVNLGTATVDLSAYQIKFFMNGATTAGNTIALEGTLAPKATYVVANNSAVQAVKDKANLLNSATWYNGDDAVALTQDDTLIDVIGQIGVDPGSAWAANGVSTQNKTIRRKTSVVSGDSNGADAFDPSIEFDVFDQDTFDDLGLYNGTGSTPTEPTEPEYVHGTCEDKATLISEVQGSGLESALKGSKVTVQGVVTLSLQGTDGLKGFFVQEELTDSDGSDATSEGIFVYDNGFGVTVENGQQVRVSGVVNESFGQTQLDTLIGVTVCGTGADVATVQIGLPVTDANQFEAVEGMKVSSTQAFVVTDNYGLGRYNEVVLASERLYNPTQIAKPGDEAKAVMAKNALNRLTLDDGSNLQNKDIVYPGQGLSANNSLRVGDTVTNINAVMGYGFSKYRLHPITQPTFTATNLRTETPEFSQEGDFKVASFNVLNYFNGDGQGAGFPTSRGASSAAEFTKQRAKIITAISAIDADLYGLLEVENDGFGDLSAIKDLINGLNEKAGSDVWAFVDFKSEQVGTDAIMSAIIYRKDRIAESGEAKFLTEVPFDYGNRALIAQGFTHMRSGETLNFVVAHLRSKGSCPKDTSDVANIDSGNGAGCWNGVRTAAVTKMNEWLATTPTALPTENTIIVGDFNAYLMEDPVQTLIDKGMTEVSYHIHGEKVHSYVYNGESGSLDHAMVSSALAGRVVDVVDWHINADEPIILDYNEEYKSDAAKTAFYSDNAFRSSDHDPVIIAIEHELPTLDAEHAIVVDENAVAGTEIGKLQYNSKVEVAGFTITGEGAESFSVAANGTITVAEGHSINFETMPKYELSVVLNTDTGLQSAPSSLIIDVNNIDETPVVESANVVTELSEKAEVGTVLATLNITAKSQAGTIASVTVTKGGDYVEYVDGKLVLKAALNFNTVKTLDVEVTIIDDEGNENVIPMSFTVKQVVVEDNVEKDKDSGSLGWFAALGLALLSLRRRILQLH